MDRRSRYKKSEILREERRRYAVNRKRKVENMRQETNDEYDRQKSLESRKKRISRRRKRAKTSSAFNVIRFLSALLNLLRLTYFDEFKIFNAAPFVDLDEDLRDIKGVIDCSS